MITAALYSLCFRLLLLQPFSYTDKTSAEGYADVVAYENGFVAVGEEGQLHQLSSQGVVQKRFSVPDYSFITAASGSMGVLAAAKSGEIVQLGSDGTITRMDALAGKTINCLTEFNQMIVVGSDDGKLYVGSGNGGFQPVQLSAKGDITALSADAKHCYGVTSCGKIISTTNGKEWAIFDFNQEYKGHYKSVLFTAVLVSDKDIAVSGITLEGCPVFYHSAKGQVWIETPLTYTNQEGALQTLDAKPNDIFRDIVNQTYYLACTGGNLMVLPSCHQCNQLIQLPATSLRAVSGNPESILIAGTNAYLQFLTPLTL